MSAGSVAEPRRLVDESDGEMYKRLAFEKICATGANCVCQQQTCIVLMCGVPSTRFSFTHSTWLVGSFRVQMICEGENGLVRCL